MFCTTADDKLAVVGSSLTGNGTSVDCGVTVSCADIGHCGVVKIKDVVCDRSYEQGTGVPGTSLGICALD